MNTNVVVNAIVVNPDALNCSVNPSQPLDKYKICLFSLSLLDEPCSAANGYGYKNGTPCVLLKMNRIYNLMPENK